MKKSSSIIIAVIVTFVVTAVGGVLLLRMFDTDNDGKTPDSFITKVDSGDNEEHSNADVSLQYAGSATLLTDEKLITLNFTNPAKSK